MYKITGFSSTTEKNGFFALLISIRKVYRIDFNIVNLPDGIIISNLEGLKNV